MPKFKIRNDKLTQDLVGTTIEFPKYTTQLINLANQNAQGTRPKVVGQMSDLIQEFGGKKYDDWVNGLSGIKEKCLMQLMMQQKKFMKWSRN